MPLVGTNVKGHRGVGGGDLMRVIAWMAALLLLVAAAMLISGIGAPGLWIAVVTIGIAMVAIDIARAHHSAGE
jgi:hypothetical protein